MPRGDSGILVGTLLQVVPTHPSKVEEEEVKGGIGKGGSSVPSLMTAPVECDSA